MQSQAIVQYCDALLEPNKFHDYAPNGLQVQGDGREIRHIVTGVTASLALIETAKEMQADALLVHHGWFWKRDEPRITSVRYQRVAALIESGMALIAYHLPLDNHPTLGNNALFGEALDISNGHPVADDSFLWLGDCSVAWSVESLGDQLEKLLDREPLVVGDIDKPIRKLAWCTGAAQSMIEEAATYGADAFISGEINECTTHLARELGIPYFACGHHATERFGIQALGEKLRHDLGLTVDFVDIENPV